GGEKREVTVLFGDLRGFTPLAENLDPQDVVDILNVYLNHVVDAVFEFGGTLDKFRGDGFMVFFGAPIPRDDGPLNAIRCALTIQEKLKRVTFPKFPDLRLHMGVGINTGIVIVGNIGSERRTDYTVIGNEVNVAQRFEANAGPGQILITGNTYDRVKNAVQVRELGNLRVAGKHEGVAAYDVLGWRAA
ncbi:MAG TPA: adenylate/guanylate cyclase domain-containing protein, partial [Candidatus Binatia bacterium]